MHKYVKQDGIKDCGVSALYNIIRYYGGNIPIEQLRKMTKTTDNGTSIYNIVKVSNHLGLNAQAYKCNIDDLKNKKCPFIVYIKINDFYHFVIIKKIEKFIYIFDPIRGDLKYTENEFLSEWQNIVILFEKQKPLTNFKTKNYFLSIVKKFKINIICISFLLIISTLFSLLSNLYFKILSENISKSSLIFLSFLVILIIKFLINFTKEKSLINFNNKINQQIRKDTYEKIFNLPLLHHHDRPVGDMVSRVNDLYHIKEFIYEISFSLIMDLIILVTILIFFLKFNYRIFYILLIINYIVIFTYVFFRKRINMLLDLEMNNNSNININFINDLMNIDTIKNLNIEKFIIKKQNNIYLKYLKDNSKLLNNLLLYNLIEDFIVSLGNIIILYIGMKYITLSNLILVNSLYFLFCDSLRKILSLDNLMINAKRSYIRTNNLLSIEEDNKSVSDIKKVNSIEFKNITFSYDEINYIVSNFNLKIKKCEYLLIDGDSGVGKSTIFKLLNKELNLEQGNILINDLDINNISNKSLKENICYVSQNEGLFNDSILNNIKMYKEIEKYELDKVLKVTMVDQILKKRNISLDYQIEENGFNLSGGERQKIILARTLLRNAHFLILDETMNEIDIKSERKILKNIKTEYKKSIILISHRTSNKDLFDRIIKIEGGKKCKN